jgi:hypothetical protein
MSNIDPFEIVESETILGMVWIAPTQGVYDKMKMRNSVANLSHAQGSMGTSI